MSQSIRSYVEDLFEYLDLYEKNYSQFQTEAFFQTYHGIGAVFQALRQQRDKAVEVDNYFLEKIKQGPLTSSDLRQLTIQVIITFFESEADTDGQSNRAYLYCRDFRSDKRDVDYFKNHLVPLLFRTGSLNNNYELNEFFLGEIGRYISKFSSIVQSDLSPENFQELTDPGKILELSRRRQDLGDDVIQDRNSLEFHLQRIGDFNKLSQKGEIYNFYIRKWDYLIETSIWAKIKSFATEIWGKIKSIFSSFRYFRLSLAQRNSAYVFYGLLIVIFVFLAIYVPMKWLSHADNKEAELNNHSTQIINDLRGK
jgi:hypothetical protein